ncbi:MAG: hypothetical protein WC501_02115 [Candidatus Micrarchaeia archaeon]
MKNLIIFLILVGLISSVPTAPDIDVTANPEATQIKNAICEIVNIVETVMGAVMLILIVMAAIIYAAGQVMGAETRARANVWATSMFLGAIIGGLIYLVVPVFINALGIGGMTDVHTQC